DPDSVVLCVLATDGEDEGDSDLQGAEPRDLHCLLVTNSHTDAWKSQGL
ncbi:PREDICTED: growth arrest and DNA damage-inducible protein GADD45 beta-like, partial [Mesitornis unicolor]